MYNQLINNLNELKLYKTKELLEYYSKAVTEGEKTFTEALDEIMIQEMRLREERAMGACVKTANFPYLKTEDDFDFEFQPSINKLQIRELLTLGFLERNENVIFIGTPGTGKTHLATAIGIKAAKSRTSTYFITFQELISQLKKANYENRLPERLKQYLKYKLLIIDELGYLEMDDEAANLFFQLVSKRYEKKSTIITTNSTFSKWPEIFKNPSLTNAVLDRLLHHSTVISIKGPSYRLKDKFEMEETSAKSGK